MHPFLVNLQYMVVCISAYNTYAVLKEIMERVILPGYATNLLEFFFGGE